MKKRKKTPFQFKKSGTGKKQICCFFVSVLIVFSAASAAFGAVTGKLETLKGKTVLYLWGDNDERGYAHGYLLADRILNLMENYMLGKIFDTDDYGYETLLLMYYVRVPLAFRMEINGMYRGLIDARGEAGIYSRKLGRDYEPADLLRLNMAEIFPLDLGDRKMCSSLSGWGKGTRDGSVVFARDLDFGSPGDLLETSSIIIAYNNQEAGFFPRNSWISFAWPGFIGCLTGMNEDGVGAASNYGNSMPPLEDLMNNVPWFYTPLAFVLREGLETRHYGISNDPIKKFFRHILRTPIAGSFNIHVFTPYNDIGIDTDPPAAVIEGNNIETGIRTYRQNQASEPELNADYFLATTNHHRKIKEPRDCDRYEDIVAALNGIDVLDMDTALDIERSVAQREGSSHTVQIIGLAADTKEIWVAFGDGKNHAYEVEPVHFTWEEIFQGF